MPTSPLPKSIESLLDHIFEVAGTEDELRTKIKNQIIGNLSNLALLSETSGRFEDSEVHKAVLGPLWGVLPFYRLNLLKRQPNPNLSRAEYRDSCLRRTPKFQTDLLQFHQEFPPIFRPLPQGRKFSTLPPWLRSRLTSQSPNLYVGSLNSLEDLRKLHSMSTEIELDRNRWERLLPYDGSRYFKAIRKQAQSYRRILNQLQERWPDVSGEVFTSGDLSSGNAFPWLLIPPIEEFRTTSPPQIRVNQKEWNRMLIQAGKKAVLMIPIWPHTVESDLDWDQIRKWKEALSRTPISRTHGNLLGIRLAVYDRYQELCSFAAVEKELKIPRKKVRDHFLRVYHDIHGAPLQGTQKARRIQGVDEQNHVPNCSRCSRADRVEDWCPTGQALLNIAESSTPPGEVPYDDSIIITPLTGGGRRKIPRPHHD
ncbi:MAG: hypothetical protein KC643_26955 [Nitrospira sp.]|nr:hypothetical protein [Nitrospira sp.]